MIDPWSVYAPGYAPNPLLLHELELEVNQKPRITRHSHMEGDEEADLWSCRSPYSVGYGIGAGIEGMQHAWRSWQQMAKMRDADARRTIKRERL